MPRSRAAWRERQVRVMAALRAHADATQAEAVGILKQAEQAGRATQVRSLWMVNGLAFRGTAEVVAALARPRRRARSCTTSRTT